jgi:hypothetical protein
VNRQFTDAIAKLLLAFKTSGGCDGKDIVMLAGRRLWLRVLLALASLLLVAACSVRIGETGDRKPGTLYVFDVDSTDSDIVVYQLVAKPRSFEQSWREEFGRESAYSAEQIASVKALRYVRISVPTGLQNYAFTTAKITAVPTFPQLSYDPNGQTFYAKVHAQTSSEMLTEATSELVVKGTANWFLRQSNLPHAGLNSPTGVQVDPLSPDEGEELLKQLKPQDSVEPQQTTVAQP